VCRIEAVRWGSLIPRVSLELQLSIATLPGQVGGDTSDAHVRAERLYRGPAHGSGVGRCSRTGREATQDRELGVDPAIGRRRRLRGGSLGEETLDIAAAIASIAARVDPEGGEPASVRPGANRVRVHAEEGGCLGNADQGLPALAVLASRVRHSPLQIAGLWNFW
jgi:hypothetical protein